MPKKSHKIEAFDGGLNKKSDPRDIEDNQLVDASHINVSNKGKISLSGNFQNIFEDVNSKSPKSYVSPMMSDSEFTLLNLSGTDGFANGHGLFSCSHDFNMNDSNSDNNNLDGNSTWGSGTPRELDVEFLCINDGAHISIWDSYGTTGSPSGNTYNVADDVNSRWITKAITLGNVHEVSGDETVDYHEKVKPIYYKAGSGIRVCDATFSEEVFGTIVDSGGISASDTTIGASADPSSHVGTYIKIDSEIIKVTDYSGVNMTVLRGQFGTVAVAHSDGRTIKSVNVPKILTHVKRPLLEKAAAGNGGAQANTTINRWIEDIQFPEPPMVGAFVVLKEFNPLGQDDSSDEALQINESLVPSTPGNVYMGFATNSIQGSTFSLVVGTAVSQEDSTTLESVVKITVANNAGAALDVQSNGFYIGQFITLEGCTGNGAIYNGTHEIVGFGSTTGEVKMASEFGGSYNQNAGVDVRLEENLMSDDLKKKWIFGMSYLYQGEGVLQESSITVASSTLSSTFAPNNFLSPQQSFFMVITDWYTADSDFGTAAFDTTETDNWDYDGYIAKADAANNEYLLFRKATNQLTAGDDYYVTVQMTVTSGSVIISLGDANGASGGSTKTLSGSGEFKFVLEARTSGGDMKNVIAIKGSNFTGDIHQVIVAPVATALMGLDNSFDLRSISNAMYGGFSFSCNNSRTNAATNYSWNERIEGFRIYMKELAMIGAELSNEWLLLYDANITDGTYVCHATGDKETQMKLGPSWSSGGTSSPANVIVTSALTAGGDVIKDIPLLSYESENGYEGETNLAAMYKSVAVVKRKVFIGNVKIGDRKYPDRMIRSELGKYDSFPNDGFHNIDITTADGDDIIELLSVNDKLIQFKKKNVFLIKVKDESEEQLDIWKGAGILYPCQATSVPNGAVWVNQNGLYYYDGKELQYISSDKFSYHQWPIRREEANAGVANPPIIGYDGASNKIIIYTPDYVPSQKYQVTDYDSGGAKNMPSSALIYDLNTKSFTQIMHGFNWHSVKKVRNISATRHIDATVIDDEVYLDTSHRPRESTTLKSDALYYTNMVNTRNNKLVTAYNQESTPTAKTCFVQWDDSPQRILSYSSTSAPSILEETFGDEFWQTTTSGTSTVEISTHSEDNDINQNQSYDRAALETDGSGNTATIYDSITTIEGQQYILEFWAKGGGVNASLQYRVFDDIHYTNVVAKTDTDMDASDWKKFTVKFTAISKSTRINFYSPSTADKTAYAKSPSCKMVSGFSVKTKDVDFGNPSIRKKVYKVYVTFKSGGLLSGVLLKYSTNGGTSWSGFDSTTYYDNSKGFDSYNGGTSTSDWITVVLTPSSSINNVYSMQLRFEPADAGIRGGFEKPWSNAATTMYLDDDELGSNASSGSDDAYNGMPLYIYRGIGAGQEMVITDYDATGATDGEREITVRTLNSLYLIAGGTGEPPGDYYDIGYIPSEFEVNDISITYREKPVK